ncbi:type III pantothenate kinase [Daejeonella lutea]|uniref:Type III pantothenate kinase n=1 Tax=Daejeonella lutea TaxID=572036 RepID=A0A1T5D3S4_9SPHI|nr:type III pantothenate kinase [Daejeonella lutea]SKB66319.1 type III pantothenate kinase [Daejeonella lutea]
MSRLVIDIGNSRTKIATFDDQKLVSLNVLEELSEDKLQSYLKETPVQQSIISSVKDGIEDLEKVLVGQTDYIRFSAANAGIDNQYKTPQTLGLDRLAGVVGAKALNPGKNCLVIDLGTCITYDAIDKDNVYRGGSISAGLKMRLRAMHDFTGRLPLVPLKEFDGLEGNDTETSMLSGVVNGTYLEIAGFIERYRSQYAELQVILCGGDANFFDTRFKNSIFAHTLKTEPDLVLIGLNEVINQQ